MTRDREARTHDTDDRDTGNDADSYDVDDYDTDLTRSDAVARVDELREAVLADRGSETAGLAAIGGRVLAEAIVASEDRPAHDRATMDGFAFDATGEYPFEVVSAVFPEDDPPEIRADEAVEIATGAPLPTGANAVLKREEATIGDGELRGTEIEPGTYVYRQGSNVAAGETLFERGERLSPKDAILLRDLGVEDVPVYERSSAGVLATGTEIHEGTQADFDSPMLCGLVDSWGGAATYEGSVPDERGAVEDRISDLAGTYDVVITTGGTSVGKKDYVLRALADLGEIVFHRVLIRPGKPIAAARLPDHDAVAFAIPGKPVGAHTIATLVMRPFFTGDGTETPTPTIEATLARKVEIGPEGFEYAVPVTVRNDSDANSDGGDRSGVGNGIEAMPLGHVDSPLSVYDERFDPSVLSSSTRATRADGFFLTESGVERDETVSVVPYTALE
jgi:molybdopterin molybdotransferase